MNVKLILSFIFIILFITGCNNKNPAPLKNASQKDDEHFRKMIDSGKYSVEALKLIDNAEKYLKNHLKIKKEHLRSFVKREKELLSDDQNLYYSFQNALTNMSGAFHSASFSFHYTYRDLIDKCPELLNTKQPKINVDFDLTNKATNSLYPDFQKQKIIYNILTDGISEQKLTLTEILKILRERALSLHLYFEGFKRMTKEEFTKLKNTPVGDIATFNAYYSKKPNLFYDVIFISIVRTLYLDYLNKAGAVLITNVESKGFDELHEKEFWKIAQKYNSVNYYLDEESKLIKNKSIFGSMLKPPNKGRVIYLENGKNLLQFILVDSNINKRILYQDGIIKKTRKFESSFFGGDKPFDPNLYFKKD